MKNLIRIGCWKLTKKELAFLLVIIICLSILGVFCLFLIPGSKNPTIFPFSSKTSYSYYGKNDIALLPYYKNGSFIELDTVVIKITVIYKDNVVYSYHLKANITKPNGSKIFINDYLRDYPGGHFYIEIPLAIGDNGTWKIDTFAEYKSTSGKPSYDKWNNGSKSFNVSKRSDLPPSPEVVQIIPINSHFASPDLVVINELGSAATFIAAKVKNQTSDKPGAFVRFIIYDNNSQILYSDSGYTESDGIFLKMIPQNTFFIEGDFLIRLNVSYSGIEIANVSGVLKIRYYASPHLDYQFLNQNFINSSVFNSIDEIWLNWNWSLYSVAPDTINFKIKLVDSIGMRQFSRDFSIDLLHDGYNVKTKILNVNELGVSKIDNYTVILETTSLIYNYELLLGNIKISSIKDSIITPGVNVNFMTALLFLGGTILSAIALVFTREKLEHEKLPYLSFH